MISEAFDLNVNGVSFGVCCYRIEQDRDTQQKKYTFVDANQAFFTCTGYEREFFEQQDAVLEQILAENEQAEFRRQIVLAEQYPGVPYGNIGEIIMQDGTRRHLKWNVRCVKKVDGTCELLFSCTSVNLLIKTQRELLDRLNKEKSEHQRVVDLIRELPFGVAVVRGNEGYQFEVANETFLKMTGCDESSVTTGQAYLASYIYKEDFCVLEDAIECCKLHKSAEEFELRMQTADGELRWELLQCQLYYYKDAIPYYMIASWDIHERKELEDELKLLEEQYRMLEEVTDEFPFEYDVEQQHFRIPHKYRKIGKIKDDRQTYMSMEQMLSDICPEDRSAFEQMLQVATEEERTGTIDYRMNVSPEGEDVVYNWYRTVYRSIPGPHKDIIRVIGRSYDISSDRRIQEKLSEEMRLDPLTRLLNKVAAGEEVKKFISEKPGGTQVLFLIDIDNFKRVNDSFGHTVGDTVISDIAQWIRENFSEKDIVGRVGGDEFLVFMKDTTLDAAVQKAKALCDGSGKQLIGDDAVVNVTLSVGVSVYGVDGEDYSSLFQMADRAMYHIKRNGKNSYSLAQDEINKEYDGSRREKQVDSAFERNLDVDKDFMNVAFRLLSHARDMNDSLNVLLEQIGKKYHLDMVSVFEYEDHSLDMVLTNYWSNFGQVYEKSILPRSIAAFEQAGPEEFVLVEETAEGQPILLYENWNTGDDRIKRLAGIKFEYGSGHTGCLFLGVKDPKRVFGEAERMTHCELSRVVSVFVTLRNKLSDDQKEIWHLQSRDRLTGLYNLETFRKKVEELFAWEKKEPSGSTYALVHVDINNFSYVNENFGQIVGDNILKEFGTAVGKLSQVPYASRMYSDYFILLVWGESREEVCKNIETGKVYFEHQQKKKYPAAGMRFSVGAYFLDDFEESFEVMLENANLARKHAKELLSTKICIYQEQLRAKRDDEIQVTGRFYGALQRGGI